MKSLKRLRNRIRYYEFNPSISIKDRNFVLFSLSVLIALYVAIPCGLIMGEPLIATASTILGAAFFTIVVVISFKKNLIAQAKIFISIILIFIFLPAMFFTNGGAGSGAPIWLLLGTIYISMILDGKFKITMLACEVLVLIACWIVGYYCPEIVIEYSRAGNYFDNITGLFIVSAIIYLMVSFHGRILSKEEASKNMQRLFEQTATALVNAIDAKDKYTHGHSSRVAEYSRKIAEIAGKNEAQCEEIYYVALLHDVGKIGIPIGIINKEGKLTEEEFGVIKQHPVLGEQILQSITEYPYISIGAHFHHERYDGKGYPLGLKGTDIPEIARIVAVADAYDAMTSKRSYRNAVPQNKVREQLIEGTGTQFDPVFANIMLHLIDLDTEYKLRERGEIGNSVGNSELVVREHKENVSEGVLITASITKIVLSVKPDTEDEAFQPKPSIILFDSLDGRFHSDKTEIEDLVYYEYCEIGLDGEVHNSGARKTEMSFVELSDPSMEPGQYRIDAVRVKDHALIKIMDRDRLTEVIVALPDSTRFSYIGLTGEHCRISNVSSEKTESAVGNDYIPRIAEEISYINVPPGDIPNVQVDGYRTDSTTGIPITDEMTITFHTKSLPTARLVWHCPSYVIFTADDGKVNGVNYQEFSLVRLDGEYWQGENETENELIVDKDEFYGWDSWKKYNLEGYDCIISFTRKGNRIYSSTKNGGISIKNITDINIETEEIYVALSGDQVALTNIRINNVI